MKTIIIDHTGDKPATLATFTMDGDGVITCDNPVFFANLERHGILGVPPDLQLVFPGEGLPFWEALPYEFNGVLRALPQQ